MLKHRLGMGLGAFGAAGVCVLAALYRSPMWITTAALWYGAAAFTWLGPRTELGKVRPRQGQVPPSSAPSGSVPPVHPLPGRPPAPQDGCGAAASCRFSRRHTCRRHTVQKRRACAVNTVGAGRSQGSGNRFLETDYRRRPRSRGLRLAA